MRKPTTKPIWDTNLDGELFEVLERLRSKMAEIRGGFHDVAFEWPGYKEDLASYDGFLTCGISSLANTIKRVTENHRKRKEGVVLFASRGIGKENCGGCYICGAHNGQNNISGFANSKEDGKTIATFFSQGVKLDYRDSEPNWIQVKIEACNSHLDNLRKLNYLVRDGGICPADLAASQEVEAEEKLDKIYRVAEKQ